MNDWLPKPSPTPAEWITRYRDTAARLREIAGHAVTIEIRDKLLEMARQYDKLVELVQRRTFS
jgi:hypothetical protein